MTSSIAYLDCDVLSNQIADQIDSFFSGIAASVYLNDADRGKALAKQRIHIGITQRTQHCLQLIDLIGGALLRGYIAKDKPVAIKLLLALLRGKDCSLYRDRSSLSGIVIPRHKGQEVVETCPVTGLGI